MAEVYAFCSNRGGVGKSSLAANMAAAVAACKPATPVLLLDMSIHGDSSRILLGGVQPPTTEVQGVRTLGDQRLGELPPGRTARGLLDATQAPAPAAGRSWWRGTSVAAAPGVFDWQAHAVRPADAHPGGGSPSNLFLAAGGPSLYDITFQPTVDALRAALASMTGVIVIMDTDAELSERGASLAALGAANKLLVVLSSSWFDFGRLLDDKGNSLFAGLAWLSNLKPEYAPKVSKLVFNGLQKRANAACNFMGTPDALTFTPPKTTTDAVEEIITYLSQVGGENDGAIAKRFEEEAAFASPAALAARYMVGVQNMSEGTWQKTLWSGKPIGTSGVDAEAANNIAKVVEQCF